MVFTSKELLAKVMFEVMGSVIVILIVVTGLQVLIVVVAVVIVVIPVQWRCFW